MNAEIKQQVVEKLEFMLEKAKTGEMVRFIGALCVDEKVIAISEGTLSEICLLLLSFSIKNKDIAEAMSLAAKIAKEKAKSDK